MEILRQTEKSFKYVLRNYRSKEGNTVAPRAHQHSADAARLVILTASSIREDEPRRQQAPFNT